MNVLVIGCGRLGASLACRLDEQGHDVVVIDEDETLFLRLGENFSGITFAGSPMNASVLRNAGAASCDAIAVVTGDEKALTAAPGVGKKLAQRIILELKDKIAGEQAHFDASAGPAAAVMPAGGGGKLAEATAERMHEEVRRKYWGYAPEEQLSVEELLTEKFTGIRPAVGYPSLPDQSINFLLSDWLGFERIGIRLTENGAMKPHASVSGLMLAHPAARYFTVGKIGNDQLEDYARRRGLPVETMRKFLAANL